MAKRKASAKKKDKKAGGGTDVVEEEPLNKVAKTETSTKSIINIDAITSLSKDIISTFQSKFTSNTKTNYQLLNECDENGTIERTLWPWFLHCAVGGDNELPGEEVAFALAILSNRRAGTSGDNIGGGGGGGDPQLWFVVDDYDYSTKNSSDAGEEATTIHNVSPPENVTSKQRTIAFAMLLKQLLKYQEMNSSSTNENGGEDKLSIATQTELIKFFIASYSSMELRCKSSDGGATTSTSVSSQRGGIIEGPLTDLVGIRLWDAIKTRKRHLEMKRDGLLRKRYSLFETKRKGNEVNVGFVPGMVTGLLNAIVILGDTNGNGDDDNDEVMSDDNHVSYQQQMLLKGYASKALELLLDLLSYPQTRTHVAPYLSSRHLVVQLVMSKLYKEKKNETFVLLRQQVDMLLDSERMEVATSIPEAGGGGEVTSLSTLPFNDVSSQQVHQRAHTLQKLLHRHHTLETSEVIFAGVGRVCDSKWLRSKIDLWKEETLYDVCYRLRLVDDNEGDDTTETSAKQLGCTRRELLSSILLYHQSSRSSDAAILSSAPLYPTETLLWDAHSLPPSNTYLLGPNNTESSLSLPKLNARFLSPGDYLLRNFRLFRLESAYEIRGDIVDVVKRMRPTRTADGYAQDNMDYYGGSQHDDDTEGESKTCFQGWARMGMELGSKKRDKPGLRLIRVDPPRLGERVPSQVIAEIVLDLHSCGKLEFSLLFLVQFDVHELHSSLPFYKATSLQQEWSEIGEFDNLFLVSVDATQMTGEPAPLTGMVGKDGEERRVPDEEDCTFPRRFGVRAVRGCMVLEVRDEAGVVLSDPALAYEVEEKPEPKGKLRFLRVALDPAQYAADATGHGSPLGTDVYETFNVVVRRHGRENNFKAVLETIRGLMQGGANSMYRSIPSWLMPVVLGYGGDPAMATHSSKKMKAFASRTPGVTSPNASLDYGDTFLNESHLKDSFEGCELTVNGKEIGNDTKDDDMSVRKKYRVKITENKVEATSYPFPPSYAGNDIRFTPVQVNAIRSGLSPGLTTVSRIFLCCFLII